VVVARAAGGGSARRRAAAFRGRRARAQACLGARRPDANRAGGARQVAGCIRPLKTTRLLDDGARAPEFATPGVDPATASLVYALALDDRAHLLISGLTVAIGGSSRGGVTRLALREPARYRWYLEQADTRLCWSAEGAAPQPFAARFERSDTGSQWQLIGDAQREGANWCVSAPAALGGQWLRMSAQHRSGLAGSSTSLLQRTWRSLLRSARFADGFEASPP